MGMVAQMSPHAYSEGGLLQVYPAIEFPFYGHKKD